VSKLVIENISAGYGAVQVLHEVSLHVNPGETVVLLGTNGNGKSTLLKSIMGIIRPSSGSISLDVGGQNTDLVGKNTEDIVALGIAMVPEGRRLFSLLSVEENLMLGAYREAARQKIKDNLDFCFTTFPRLKERRKQQAGSLSGGEQQMVAVARSLMSNPNILLIDEPSVGLAPILVSQMILKIKELKEMKNLTVLMAEQNFNQAIKIADRGYVIVHGEMALSGESAKALSENKLVKQLYLGV
jgi:branched-chain amino acid transport system ATP-binding protein